MDTPPIESHKRHKNDIDNLISDCQYNRATYEESKELAYEYFMANNRLSTLLTKIFASRIKGLTCSEAVHYIQTTYPKITLYVNVIESDHLSIEVYENENKLSIILGVHNDCLYR
jgi:hypothetical protein